MATPMENLRVLKLAEEVADGIWKVVLSWDDFPRDVVGKQMTRSADSIGANIAESYGRFHYGEKLQFLYYARGSLFETKYWLNRSLARGLFDKDQLENYSEKLSTLAHQLNLFAASIKRQKAGHPAAIREQHAPYNLNTAPPHEYLSINSNLLFSEKDLQYISKDQI